MTGIEALEKAREKIRLEYGRTSKQEDVVVPEWDEAIGAAVVIISELISAERDAGNKGYTKEDDGIGKWLSAALDDPKVCAEFKADIRAWFDSKERDAGETKPKPGAYREAAMAYQDLATCYRLGTRPPEKLFSRIEKARELLSEPTWEDHDLYVYDDAKPESAKPEPGDVVAWPNPPHGHVMIGLYGRDWTSDIGLVVLMRAAEVKRRIEGEK